MPYATYEHHGSRSVGEVSAGMVIPLEGPVELGIETTLEMLRSARRRPDAAVAVDDVTLLPVVPNPGKIICIGLNYHSHVTETKRDLPTYPVMFPKYPSSLIGPYDDIILPPESSQVDYEGELAVIIGRVGRRITEDDALDHVLGYAVANDVTMRDFQYKTHQWMQGKTWDTSTPIGPYLTTPDETDLRHAGIRTVLNGAKVQESDLSRLIFSVCQLIATISVFTTLLPGDVILTGTPGGVGYRRDPQLFLRDGDTVRVEVDGLGAVENIARCEAVAPGGS